MDKPSDHSSRSANGEPPHSATGAGAQSSETWSKLSSAEQESRLTQFFESWTAPPSEDLTNCPPDGYLLDLAKNSDPTGWPKHVQDCSRCKSLIRLVGDPEKVRVPASVIMARASQLAWDIEHRERKPWFTPSKFANAFYTLGRAQAVALGAVLLAVVAFAGWISFSGVQTPPPGQVIAFEEDPYWKATEWLRAANTILEDPDLKSSEKVSQLQPLKPKKDEIDKTISSLQKTLDDERKLELGTLLATYNNQTRILTASLNPNNAKSEDLPSAPINPTPESTIVTQVWAAFGAMNKTDVALDQQNPKAVKALLEAAEYTEVTKITQSQSGTDVVVSFVDDRKQSRPEVQQGINLLEAKGMRVFIVPHGEKSLPLKARKKSFADSRKE